MTTAFPAALDNFANPTPGQSQAATRSHSLQHSDLNDALEALQAKMGIDGSTSPNTVDYKLRYTPYTPGGTGAIAQVMQDELRRTVRPEHYGAVGDGVSDDTAAIAAAALAAGIGGRVHLRPGKVYLISDSIIAGAYSNFVEFYSGGSIDRAGKIKAAAGMNKPMFVATGTNKFKFNGVALLGSSTTGAPLSAQSCIRIETTNNVEIRNCYLGGAHNLIDIQGVSFYTRIENVYFADCTNAWINGQCAVANGFDITITQCNGTSSQSAPYAFFFDGLGSLIMSDCQFSPSHCTVGGLWIESRASLQGPCFYTNVIFELGSPGVPSLKLKGTSSAAIRWQHFTNCYFYGDASVSIDYAQKCTWDNCYFTGAGDGASGRNAVRIYGIGTDLAFNNCAYEVTNVPYSCDPASTAISLYITTPRYNGAFQFIDFTGITTAANVQNVWLTGGNIGSNTNPVRINGKLDRNAYINAFGEAFGPMRDVTLVGTFAATGTVTIAHGITNGQQRVHSCAAYTRGGSGQMVPLTVGYVDGNNVQITSATSGAVYRINLRYSNVTDTNWP